MINFHLGLPGILTNLSDEIWSANRQRRSVSGAPPTQERYAESVRPFLVSRRMDHASLEKLRLRALMYIDTWPRSEPIVISDPLLMGGASELMKVGPCFAGSSSVIERICDLFEGWDLRFHLVMVSQFDAIWMQPHVPIEQRVKAVRICDFSWSNLVWRMRRSSRGSRIVVWNAERPDRILPLLRTELLGTGHVFDAPATLLQFETGRNDVSAISIHFHPEDFQKIDLLDRSYDEELLKIASLSRVSLYPCS